MEKADSIGRPCDKYLSPALAVCCCLLQAQDLLAQMSPATLPNLTVSMGGEIFAMVVQDDGKVILGGDFTSVNGVLRTNLARVNPNGSLDVTWSPNPDGVVSNLILRGSEIYASGAFTNIGGHFRTNLAKLNISGPGLADPVWAPQPDGPVYCMALAGSNLYVGGGFTHIGGAFCQGAARISAQGAGSATSWTVDAGGGQILSIVATIDDIFLGGSFTTINGVARRNLVKLSAAIGAAVDRTWNPAPDAVVNTLTLSGMFLVVGGEFSSLGGTSSGPPLVLQTNLARVNLSGLGAADTSWRPELSMNSSGCTNAKIYSVMSDEAYIYVTGQFDNAGGLARQGVARFGILDGLVDHNWVATIRTFNRLCVLGDCWYPSCISFDGDFVRVRTLVRVPSGIYAGGRFSLVAGEVALGTAKLDALSGAPDRSFSVQTGRQSEDRRTGLGQIFAIATQDDGKLLLGGRFELIDGKPRLNLARLNVDGTLDEFWQPNPNDRVLALATRGNDIFVGGDFTWIGGTKRSGLAKLSATGSDAANPDWAPNPNSRVNSIAVRGTNLCAVGDFTAFGDPPVTRSSVAFISTEETGQVLPQVPEAFVTGVGFSTYGQFVNTVMDDTYAYLYGGLVVIGGVTNLGRIQIATGQADDSWKPPFAYSPDPDRGPEYQNFVEALVVNGTNVFIGGLFSFASGQTNLARLDYVTGAVNTTWNPRIFGAPGTEMAPRLIVPCSALALCGSNLYIAGTFTNLNDTGLMHLARLDAFGTGAVDTAWMPQPDREVYRLCTRSNDVFAAGYFGRIGGASRSKLAFFPTADAPSMFKVSATNFIILRNPRDGFEVTHFRVTGITNGVVYRTDGVTPVKVGDFVTTEEGEAGLIFVAATNGTVTAVSALNATPPGAGSASSTLNFSAPQPPVLSFSSASYSTNEGAFVTVSVRRRQPSASAVTVTYIVSAGTAHLYNFGSQEGDYFFDDNVHSLTFNSTDQSKSFAISLVRDEQVEGDETFTVSLLGATGGVIAYPGTATITIIDDDCVGPRGSFAQRMTPGELPLTTGALRVDLQPTNVGKWRLAGDLLWRDSGTEVHGLVDGYYQVLLKPVLGYYPPPSTLTAQVNAGVTNALTALYFSDPNVQYGDLRMVLAPECVATNGGMWMAEDGVWRNSGDITTLAAGAHEIQFREVKGWSTPRNTIVTVPAGAECNKAGNYEPTNAPGIPVPNVLSFSDVTNHQGPYQFNGLIETDFGFGSGVVVKERVVLTAAHVLFDDYSLSYAKRAKWFFQKHHGEYEPPGQVPRGWYVFQGYAAERETDANRGPSSFAAENLDAAAIYFVRNNQPTYGPNFPGRGGYGGFLFSEVGGSEWLQSARSKMLVGYPIDGISSVNQGKMHATERTNLTFSRVFGSVYVTTNIVSYGGNSGGPLYVQADDGQFYPAAIYLGGGSQSLVRAIDEQVVCLINFAEISGNDDRRHTGGGVAVWSAGVTTDPFNVGLVGVRLSPSSARAAGAAWRVRRSAADFSAYLTNNELVSPLIPGPFLVEFKRVPGFATPVMIEVQATVDQTNWYNVSYPVFSLSNPVISTDGSFHLTLNGATGQVYAVEGSTNLTNWTTLAMLTNRAGALQFTNQASNVSRFFYRGREL